MDDTKIDHLTSDTWAKEAHRCKRVWMFNTETEAACHNPYTLHRCSTTGDPYHFAEQVWHIELGDEGQHGLFPILH